MQTNARRRIARQIAGAYLLFAGAWIAVSDLALFELAQDLPSFAGGSLIKGAVFVVISAALLYVLVSQHLRPFAESISASSQPDARRFRGFNPALVFGAMAMFAIALVIAMFSYEAERHRGLAHNYLSAIVELKADQLELLLAQTQASARSYRRSRSMREDMTNLAQRQNPETASRLEARLEFIRQDLAFDALLAFDAAGKLAAGVGPGEYRHVSPEFASHVAGSLASGKPVLGYLHRDPQVPGEPVFLDHVVPMHGISDPPAIVGALVFRQNARGQLFRLVQDWPAPSPTAETLLVRRDGNDVLYLNDVRHAKDTAFRLRRPLSETGLTTVKAVGAGTTPVEGRDYRGIDVVAAARPIAGTDWFMIAKVDRDEILAPVRRSAFVWLVSILCMSLLAAAGAGALWRQQLRLIAAGERALAAEREVLARHLDFLSKHANDFIFLTDEDGRIVEVNDRVIEMYQWPREELIGRPAFELRAPGYEASADEQQKLFAQKEGVIFETAHQRRDGSVFPVEVSARALEVEGRRYVQGIVRDITERKRAEEILRQSEGRYRGLVEQSLAGIYVIQGNRFRYVNPRFAEIFGYAAPGEIVDRLAIEDLVAPGHRKLVMENLRRRLESEIPEIRYGFVGLKHDGAPVDVEVHGRSFPFQGAPAVIGMILDVTERKQSEARIARLTHLRNALSDVNRAIVHAADEDALFAEICAIAVRHAGFILAWIGVPDKGSGAILPLTSAGGSAGRDYVSRVDRSYRDIPAGRGPAGTAIREERVIVSNDFLGEHLNAPWHEAARDAGIRASAALPLRRNGEVVAVLVVYSATPAYFDSEIVGLLEEMAQDVSFSLGVLERDRERKVALSRAVELTEIVDRSPAVFYRVRAEPGWPFDIVSESVMQFGYKPEDLLSGRVPVATIIHPEDLARLKADAARFVERGLDMAEQGYRIQTGSGETRWVEDRTWALRGTDGSVTHFQGLMLDITERKRAEDLLRESETRFRAVLEQSIAAVYVIQDNRIVYVNPRMREIFGYGPDEPVDTDPLSHIQMADRARVAEQMALRVGGEAEAAYAVGALRKDGTPFTLGVHAKQASFQGRPAIIAIAQDITEKARAEEEIKRYVARLEQAMQSTINVVATIGELRDPYTHGHERRVGEIAAAIAVEMGLDASRVEGIRVAGYLHDVGKIGVPAEILAKPTRLTKAEFELVKEHAQQSYEILKGVEFPWPVAEAAWQHHERLDGSGYPRGLKGEEIIPEARVLSVADVVEAMASHRPYRPGLGIDAALVEIEQGRGRLYDPQVADACLRLFRERHFQLPA